MSIRSRLLQLERRVQKLKEEGVDNKALREYNTIMATRKLSDELKRFLAEAAEKSSIRKVGLECGIAPSTLSRILSGKRALSEAVFDTLGAYLKLELVKKE